MTFIHLKVRTSYSLLESALPIAAIAKLAAADSMPAIGITDTDNMFGALEASDKLASAGIQPIIGTSLQLASGGVAVGRIALLSRNDAGYASLCALSSEAHLRPASGREPSVATNALATHTNGLLALSGGQDGPIDSAIRAGKLDLAEKRLRALADMFPGAFYVEIQRHGIAGEESIEEQLLQLAYALELPIVATHDVLFASTDDYEAHDALLAIGAGKRLADDDRRRVSREQWFKPQTAMKTLFADLPEAISSTVEIAKRCSSRPRSRKPLLPHVSDDEESELRRQARSGLDARLAVTALAPGFARDDYDQRLSYECDVIAKMGFPGYFLIVSDFIKWAKANSIPVGPGRGSGAGSLVAWALTITDLDPLRFGLLFERFLNPERVSMPDFDIDFCQDRRDEVIKYVQQKYGEDRVAQIITHGKLQARAVVRDVGRVLSMSNGYIDKLAKLIPVNPADPIGLSDAFDIEPRLRDARKDPTADRLFEIALKLEGLYKHASTHAAGLVIGDRPLHELLPVYKDPGSDFPITQFNWKLTEAAGLVKFDFLGLKTLSVIARTLRHIRDRTGMDIDMSTLPVDDAATYELLASADTVGVFQLESTGMRESLLALKPDRLEDIIAMVALYRPGPMDNIPAYVARKHGKEPISYPHPMLERILEETYGVIIYQEQVIQIAQTLSGYTLGQADILRRAMGKKDKDEMAKQRARFVDGAVTNGVSETQAGDIFDLVDKFAGYGFNKSHAAAYALIGYHTAYLKAHYREEFLAASMTYEMGDTEKLFHFAREARRSGIAMLPPDINEGSAEFMPVAGQTGAVRYALSGLKRVGPGAADAIVRERSSGGAFASLSDFCRRVAPRDVGGKLAYESLASAGAFDKLDSNRARVHASAGRMVEFAKKESEDSAKGVLDLFGQHGGSRVLEMCDARPWSHAERCSAEHAAVGYYMTEHPLDPIRASLRKRGVKTRAEVERMARGSKAPCTIAGVVISVSEKISQKGNPYAMITLSDEAGVIETIAFSDAIEMSRDFLFQGAIVVCNATAEPSGDGMKYLIRGIEVA